MDILGRVAIAFITVMVLWYFIRYFRTDGKLPAQKQAELLAHLGGLQLGGVTFAEDEPFDRWTEIEGARPISRVRAIGSTFEFVEVLVWGRGMGSRSVWLDYAVTAPELLERHRLKETRFKFHPSRGYYWAGDVDLANRLNRDTALNERIGNSGLPEEYLSVVAEPLFGRVRIRTRYHLAAEAQFALLTEIAGRVQEFLAAGEPTA